MAYQLVFYSDGKPETDPKWLASLADAQNFLKEKVHSGRFNAIEIVNENGRVCLRHRQPPASPA